MSDFRAYGVMLDPSWVLSDEGANWLMTEGATHIESLVVSRAFYSALERAEPDGLTWFAELREPREMAILRNILGRARLFSHEEADVPEPEVNAVRSALYEAHGTVTGAILIDEWIFLQTQSWIGAKSRKTFDAFVKAGARMRDVPRRVGRLLVARTLRKKRLPEQISLKMLLKAGMKWLAVGGQTVNVVVPPPWGQILGAGIGVFWLFDP